MDSTIRGNIENSDELIVKLQKLLTSIPAVSPDNGGDGEWEKAIALKSEIASWGFDTITDYFAEDKRVSSGKRPSVIAEITGKDTTKSLWIISHLDVVPPGDENLWDTPPFEAVVKGDRIYGRGTEDNQQGIVASLIAAKTLIDNKIKPAINIKLLFVADEEMGSEYGIVYLINQPGLFKEHDLILTPDVGDPEGNFIEVAEKSILWLEFDIKGKQSHGSRPDLGINAARASSILDIKLSVLNSKFADIDRRFDIPYSTFEPTKRVGSVSNFNTIPGHELLCYDCRILPQYDLEVILKEVNEIIAAVETETKTKITLRLGQKIQAPQPTADNAPIVQLLSDSIYNTLGIKAKTYGIGGGTVAAYFRMKNISAALWSTLDNTMHSPNEYSSIKNTKKDAAVFAEMMLTSK